MGLALVAIALFSSLVLTLTGPRSLDIPSAKQRVSIATPEDATACFDSPSTTKTTATGGWVLQYANITPPADLVGGNYEPRSDWSAAHGLDTRVSIHQEDKWTENLLVLC
jgi:hypothetical protein